MKISKKELKEFAFKCSNWEETLTDYESTFISYYDAKKKALKRLVKKQLKLKK